MKLRFLLILLISSGFSVPHAVLADIVHEYVSMSCSRGAREGVIRHFDTWNDENAPRGYILLTALPRFQYPSDDISGIALCPKGSLKKVTVKGQVDGDHPRNDGLRIYVDGRILDTHPISFNQGYGSYSDEVVFKKSSHNTILMLECVYGKTCRNSIIDMRKKH